MDVRQFALLARQPSAALKNRERFLGLPKRGLAFLLANVMFWQPLWAQADGIVVSAPGTTLDQAGNGVPIVNIARPNGSGLSHNQFQDYNVGSNGLILNNATTRTQSTQLGGIILGNPNFKGTAATTILNEVNGGNPSQLRGYTEVAGQSAHVIVANPYGISCSGCGFINTPQATLTTGKVVINNGQVSGYQVDQGSVSIEGAGLNANNIDRFEIITRSVRLNAEIQAKNLAIIAGANDVDAQTLKATARLANPATAPQLAIDSSALGGMYAGAIKLVGTEAGVGVKLDGKMVASGGDIQLDANGHLSMVGTAATGAVKVKARSVETKGPVYAGTTLDMQTEGDLTSQNNLVAKDRITLASGAQLTNNGIIEAGVNLDDTRNTDANISISAQRLNNLGKNIIASRDLDITTTQTLNNQGGTLSGQRQTTVIAGTLDNRNKGRVLSADRLTLTADKAVNGQDGLISSNGDLVVNVGALGNRGGEISSLADVTLNVASLDNTSGLIAAGKGLSLTASGAINNRDGTLSSLTLATLKAVSLDNTRGQITGDLGLNIDLRDALDNHGGILGSGKALTLAAASLDNRAAGTVLAADGKLSATLNGAFDNREQGKLRATGSIELNTGSLDNRGGSLVAKDHLTLRGGSADNRGGLIQADKDLKLLVDQLDNRGKGNLVAKAAIGFEGTRLDNSGGLLSAVGPISLKAKEVANTQGRIASQGDLEASIDGLSQQGGALVAQGSLLLTGKSLDNRNGGTVASTQGLTVNVGQIDNRAGELSSTRSSVSVSGQRLDNSDGGKLLAETDLGVVVAQVINQNKGHLFARGSVNLNGTTLDNNGGNISALQGLDIRLDGALLNNTGLLSSEGALSLKVGTLDNTAGKLGSAADLSIDSLGALLNQGGSILTDQDLVLASSSLDNSRKGLISGKGATRVTTGTLDNSQGGRLTSDDRLDLTATQVSNGTSGRIASTKELTASATSLDQQGGELFSKTQLSLDLHNGRLINSGGLINGPLLVLKNLDEVVNRGGEISSAQAFALAAKSLDNSNGKLLSNQGLTLRIDQALSNIKGLVAAVSLDSRSASLDNSQGLISSRGAIDLGVSGAFINQSGTLVSDGTILLAANSLDNGSGAVSGKADVTANIASLDNRSGKLIASGALTLSGALVDNRQNGLVGATKALTLDVGAIDNRGGELSSSANIHLTGKRLDNSDSGKLLADTTLTLEMAEVLNRNLGLLRGKTGVTLDGQTLDNGGGQLLSDQDARLTLGADLDNGGGLISSEGRLDVSSAGLANTAGSLSSAGVLEVKANGALSNQGGRLVSDSSINLSSASLDNTQLGVISGKGAVTVSTGAYDNRTGSLSSSDRLALTAGQVSNQNGRIGSDKALVASVTGLDQQEGKLFSNTALTLDLNNGQLNNQNGLINAPSLALDNLKGVNNQGGEISSAQAFALTADSLDNSNGKLLSNQAVTLRINQALANLKGQIAAAALDIRAASLDNSGGTVTSRSDLDLTTSGQLINRSQGLINAAQALKLSSADLDNHGGTLLGAGAVTLNAMALSNSGSGLINSQGGLTINASSLDSGNGGEVSAKGDIDLTLGSLAQNGGRLLGNQAIRLDLTGGDLDNRNGLLNARGALTLNGLRDLNNQGGELSSNQSFNLVGRTLDNSGGKLISNNQLGVTGNSLLNQGGLISGWQGLAVNGASLDNRNSGTLSSRNGNLGVNVSGTLLNSNAGALVSQQALTINAASLDNSAGILSSGGVQQLTVNGLLNNAHGGSIDSGAALTLQAMALNNSGTISAQQSIGFTGTTLDNSNGILAGKGSVSLDLLGVLTNTNGKLASAGPLVISRSSQIGNQGGQLVSQGLLSLFTGSLDNRNRGTVAANDNLVIISTGAIQNNSDGLIYSQNGDVRVDATSLANGKGSLQGQGALNLTVSGDIDNQSGRLIAQNGDLSVSAANLDNRGGTLASVKSALEARIVGVLKNSYALGNNRQGGIVQAQRLNLGAQGGIDNYGGRIAAQSGDALVTTADFDNRNGGLYAERLVQVSGNSFDNSGDNGGQIAGQSIDLSLNGVLNNRLGVIESDSTLRVRAASLDNQTGQIRALGAGGKTDFQIGGLFDNRNGKLETANSDLTLNASGFQNLGGRLLHVGDGTFDISTANITNAGGSLVTRGGLTLTADSWTNSSVIQAGRLTVNVNTLNQTAGGQLLASDSLAGNGGNWNNDGLIASDGTANLNLSGSYNGRGRYTSLNTLGLTAASFNLGSTGSIAGGADTLINVGGQANNYGRITSAAGMRVNAGSINNYGTLGSNANLLLNTPGLLNENGLMFSGGDTKLQVNGFTNHTAQLYSLGAVSIEGFGGQAQSAQVTNISGSLESIGRFSINAASFENRTEGFSLGRKLISASIAVRCLDCGGGDYDLSIAVRETYEGQDNDTSAAALLSAGGDFVFTGGDFLNSKSTVSAGGNISIQASNLTNVGSMGGIIERTRSYRTQAIANLTALAFVNQVVSYNARNDPDYPNIFYINDSGGLSKAIAETYQRPVPVGSPGTTAPAVRFRDAVTGQLVTTLAFGTRYGLNQPPQYDPNNLMALPAQLQSYTQTGDVEVSRDGSGSGRSAIIQAGGKVSITAAQNLNNSVIHQDYAVGPGSNKVQGTQAAGTGAPVVIRLNAQLPPDLAKQQVNPLVLPGFSLPIGQNGLFRLSGQGGSPTQASQANAGAQSWSMGSAAVSSAQRQQGADDVQARNLQFTDAARIAASNLQLEQATRQATGGGVSGSVINVSAPGDSGSVELPGQGGVVSPVGIQVINRVQGLPDTSGRSNPQKYLIETNPVLTDLRQFMSSDYLLANLGYNPDESAKRLGDGFYEQKLIQQAVIARTGQRFIDGQTSDEALYRYLMDNAIKSKQQLDLSVGVSLTSQQVAALTHDIVWLEEHEVNGEKVLVPVLYLAHATNRLAPNGALIQGSDVTLIAGKNLNNAGTLRASNNLAATAGNDLVNSGLIEAGNRLDLLAGNDIINKAGGVIAGRDVNMTAIAGDVINQRMVTGTDIRYKGENAHSEYVDSGSRIESANDLTIKAARDFVSTGSTLQSGGDTTITAGRDAFIAAAEQHNSVVAGAKSSSVTQYGSDLTVGRDLSVQAGRDLAVVASQIKANQYIDFGAGENLTVASAANESHSYSKSKKVTKQEDHVKQISSVVSAGQDVTFNAGNDMTLISSRINAGNEAYLAAVGQLDVLAAQDTDYSLYDKKKKGSWGRKQTRHDEVTKTINVGTQITTGRDLTLVSGGDQRYQVAKLESGADLTLRSGGAITFEGVKDLSQESHEKSNNSLAWNSSKGKGHTDETLRQSELISKGDLAITAAKGVHIDIKQIDQKTVSQTIDAMVQADPQLAWLKEAEQRGDVDWQRVKEVHDSFKYSNSGMGTGAMLAVVIIVTVLTAGSGTAATVGTSASGAATAVGISATTATAIGAAASAAYTAAVVQSVVSTINNKGNLGAVLKDVTSTESLKGYLTSGLAAGFASGVLDKAFGVSAENASKATHGFELASTDGLTKFVGYTLAEKGFGAVTNTAINGGSLKNNLAQASISAAADVLSASIYNRLGTQLEFTGIPAKVGAHAIVGGLIAEAAGGSFRTGALAAGANEAFVASVGDKIFVGDMHDQLLAMTSQLIGVTVSAAAGGSDKEQEVAGWVAQQATKFNSLDHPTAERLLNELKGCKSGGNCTEAKQRDLIDKFEKISAERSQLIDLCETRACVEGLKANTIAMDDPVAQELLSFYRNKVSYDMVGMLVGNPGLIAQPAQGYDPWGNTYVTDDQIITAKYIKEGWLTPAESANLKEWENKTSWLDDAAGRKLSVAERAAMISNMGNTLLTEGWGTKVIAGVGKGGKPGNGVSTDADGFGNSPTVTKPVKPCCFAAGTMVATPQGPRAIDTLSVGDIVWSKRETGGEPFAAAISATHIRTDQPIYQLKLKNIRADGVSEKETLLVTPGHPFYVPARHDFVPVIQLKSGDLLQSLGDGPTEGVSTRVESLELFLPQGKTYNLTVDVGHTFYVGKLKTWVHNVGLCDINGKPVVPRNAKNLEGGPLEKADKFSGHFMLEGGPASGTLYRADNKGNITSYAVYDDKGMILKRVDVTGDSHAGIPTPHAIDYGRNKLPDGSIRVQSPSSKKPPRGISAEEIP
ncbi:two-partner secretion domain-containing protein [Pseudomonas thivervalensis]|uniref:two-partner secretion domain-containing protein n=1 Tax=Pseudomonas thivervalensis TaxID=86265 RepID=UPI0009E679AC|nr:filamentous hemagglutinin N-terminal domain-containing protein [Pseudomonas thivervalensis]